MKEKKFVFLVLGTGQVVPFPPFRQPRDGRGASEQRRLHRGHGQDRPQALQGGARQAVNPLSAILGHNGRSHGTQEVTLRYTSLLLLQLL